MGEQSMHDHRPDFPAVGTSVLATVGRTPLVVLERLSIGLPGLGLAKLEFFHPGHSVKDRMALRMIEDAERDGRLTSGQPVVELTSGNTGTGLAIVCAVKGYPFYAVMSAGNSVERRQMLRALGAHVVLVPQVVCPIFAPGGRLRLCHRVSLPRRCASSRPPAPTSTRSCSYLRKRGCGTYRTAWMSGRPSIQR
jgi:hypothetical protein